MKTHTICETPIARLTPRVRNPRTHTKRQIRQVAESIRKFGFTNPIVVDSENNVLAGHARLEAAKLLGIATVPTILLAEMTEADKRAYVIADNRLAQLSGWDIEILAEEFQFLSQADVDFDVTITGFDTAQIDLLLEPSDEPDEADAPIPKPDLGAPAVTRPGDVWQMGRHRLLCGDALDSISYQRVMHGESAEMVFADPPYNVRIDGHVSGLGAIKHEEFAMACGEMSVTQYISFLSAFMRIAADYSVDGSIHFVCIDWRHVFEVISAGRAIFSELKNICVWAKTNAGMGSFYRSQHELICVFKHGRAPHVNNFELGQHGRHRTNLWTCAGMNTFGHGRSEELQLHPTVKPVALVKDAILDCSNRGSIVLDPFVGSGTTLIAAELVGRCARVIELSPHYADVTIRRWQELTGDEAIELYSKRKFDAGQVTTEGGECHGQIR